MKIKISFNSDNDKQQIYTFSEILNRCGIYKPVSDTNSDFRFINNNGCLYITRNTGVFGVLNNKLWEGHLFIEVNESITITFDNKDKS